MSFGHVGNVELITSYEEADKFYNSKPAHTRCKGWQSDERCLKERASGNHHYRITQYEGGEFYDISLYTTVMARYYRPNEQGQRLVLYAGHSTATSKNFMWRVLNVWEQQSRETTDERVVITPVYTNNVIYDRNDRFSLALMLDADRRVIVNQSHHSPHYVHRSSEDDKAKRKRVKEKFSTYVTLAQLRMPEFAENCSPGRYQGTPFGGSSIGYSQRMAVESMWEGGDVIEQEWVDEFFEMCQEIFDTLVAKRGYNQEKPFNLSYRYHSIHSPKASTVADLEKPITEKDFERSILNKVYKLVGADHKSTAVEQPQFMDTDSYPRSTITSYA